MILLVDLDGVVYRASEPVPGVAAVLADRAARGDQVVYVTNNAMYYRTEYVDRLAALGAPVSPDRVVSSARATALYLTSTEAEAGSKPIRRVLALGAEGLRRELTDVGLQVVMAGDAAERRQREGLGPVEAAGNPDAVVVGLDREVTYDRLAIAAEVVRSGVRFVATNRDPVYPMESGLQPGSGSVVAAVETASGVTPLTIGKPQPFLLEAAAKVAGGRARDTIVVGDGLLTDLAAARAVGARSVLMLTGVTSREQADAIPADQRPTAIAADAAELAAALEAMSSPASEARPEDRPSAAPEITIRAANDSDEAELTRVYLDAARHHASIDAETHRMPDEAAALARIRAKLANEELHVFVAEAGGEVVGMVEVERMPEPAVGSMLALPPSVRLGIAVAEGRRGLGIGARMMEFAERWAVQNGCPSIVLDVSAANSGALRFYERRGYRTYDLLMRKDLGGQ